MSKRGWWRGLRDDRLFWAAVVCFVGLFPIFVLSPWPLGVWLLLLDFLCGVALFCVWLERHLSEQGIKDAAKRYAKFVRLVEEELRKEAE